MAKNTPRLILRYDGSFDGLLSAIFRAYASKHPRHAIHITDHASETDLFGDSENIHTDHEHARRVFTRLQKQLGGKGMMRIMYGYLSGAETMPDTLLRIIERSLAQPHRRDIFADYGDADIMQWAKWVKSVAREKHRMEAFIRFEALADGHFLAQIAPQYDVLPLIARHFRKRYPQMRWGIFDTQRDYGICHENGSLHLLAAPQGEMINAAAEDAYQRLWQSYFQSASIASRRNLRLQRQQMPKRYWQYLTEKQTSLK